MALWLLQDPELRGVGAVLFDEFHERSLEADTALALCLDCQRLGRADLRCYRQCVGLVWLAGRP